MALLLVNVLPFGWLQEAVAAACVALSALVGLDVTQLSPYVILLSGWPVEIAVACTMIDYYFGFAVFAWSGSRGLWGNVRLLAGFFPILMAINLIRLIFGFWLFSEGIAWPIAHEVVMACVYFGLTEGAFELVRNDPRTNAEPHYSP